MEYDSVMFSSEDTVGTDEAIGKTKHGYQCGSGEPCTHDPRLVLFEGIARTGMKGNREGDVPT
jgi:hypothetical protein